MSTKVALITGVNRGGRSMALHLAKAGVSVLGTYRTHKEEAEAVEAAIAALGTQAFFLPLNVAESSQYASFHDQVVQSIADRFQTEQFDFLINNAGIDIQTALPAPQRATSTSWSQFISKPLSS